MKRILVLIILFLVNSNLYSQDLMKVIRTGTVEDLIENLINFNLDLNQEYGGGFTPLMAAVWSGNLDKVKVLVESGADVNKANAKNFTALKWAIIRNKIDIVRYLLDNGAEVDQLILELAIKIDNQEIIEMLSKECQVCFDNKLKSEVIKLTCNHEFCSDCLIGQADIALREKSTGELRCPFPDCRKKLEESDIRQIYKDAPEKIEEFCDIATRELLAQGNNIKHCPTPDCQYSFEKADDIRTITQCPSCNERYCCDCLVEHDLNITCEQEAARRLAENQEEDAETIEWKRNNIKNCPNCRVEIQKNDGCLDMHCTQCNVHFWWCCLRLSNNHDVETHAPNCRNRGRIFGDEEVARVREQERRQFNQQNRFNYF